MNGFFRPDDFILRSWSSVPNIPEKVQCNYCDFIMDQYPESKRKMRYSSINSWSNEVVGHFVDDNSKDFYEKQKQLDKIKVDHWNDVHGIIPDDYGEQWKYIKTSRYGIMKCEDCGYQEYYDLSIIDDIMFDILDKYRKSHRRICDPSRFTFSY
jgi:hypothetical protein